MKQKRLDRKILFTKMLGGKCLHCGTTEDLAFDHINPSSKKFDISQHLDEKMTKVVLELVKCQLLCRSCHGKKTRKDNGYTGVPGSSGQPLEYQHGTSNGYNNHKCRCISCRAANTLYARKRKEAKRTME